MTERDLKPETLAAHALGRIDEATGAIIPPIYPSTTYERDADLGYSRGRSYSRADNPTYDVAADTLTALESDRLKPGCCSADCAPCFPEYAGSRPAP